MIAKCANAACSAPFLYLREGKVFRMEFAPDPNRLEAASAKSPKPARKIEHFWLCGSCSVTLTLISNKGRVETIPIHSEIPRAAAS